MLSQSKAAFSGALPLTLLLLLAGCGSGGQAASTPVQTVPFLSLSTSSLTFSAQQGSSSAAQSVTLTNTGTATLSLNSISVSGTNPSVFSETTTCGTTLGVSATCTVSITFTPTAATTYSAAITLSDNAANSPQTVALSGTGTAAPAPIATLSLSTLSFPSTVSGAVSAAQSVTLSNTGNATITLSGITLSGSGAANFTESNTCGSTLAVGANCSISASFAPVTVGAATASINIADNATGSPQSITLAGTATAPPAPTATLSTSSLGFTQAAESVSAAQTATLSNTGPATLNISSITLSGAYATSFAETNTCGATLAVNASCTISVTFNPYLAMSGYAASVVITSNAASSPSTIALTGTGTGTITLNTNSATAWTIGTGAINLTWNSTTGNVVSVQLAGTSDQLVDTTTTSSNGQPDGLYMDNVGLGGATPTAGYKQVGNEYLDFWITYPSSSTNAFTWSEHFIVTANDPGLHVYFTTAHSATDVAGSLGQIQYVFRINQSLFTNTYSNNSGLNNLGPWQIALPSIAEMSSSDPGRAVQNAAEDLHGFSLPTGFGREFMTKYDYSSYEYLHQEHGLFGTTYGAWTIVPKLETLSGGPTKQDLIFTENILMMEAYSDHLDNPLTLTPPQGVATSRLFGPFCFEFNKFDTNHTTPAALYSEAQQYLPFFNLLYDNDATLTASGYVPSTGRGTVAPTISGGGSSTTNAAWTVLSDSGNNFQLSSLGLQYWVNNNATGTTTLTGVVPGTYRLSHYVLGQWGELRTDGVVVAANQTTTPPSLKFTPENFSNYSPIWTIGTPDRSAHEFLHGSNTYGSTGSCSGCDDREFWGNWNYWSDFAANKGMQVFYATAEGTTPASSLTAWNYNLWQQFDPGLYAVVYNAADDTTDGYQYAIPSYVATLAGAAGTNGVTTNTPGATIHFTTTAAQQAQGSYAVLSLGLAAAEGSVIATLNGHQTIWHYSNASDAVIRSGLAGYYEWGALEWPTSDLAAAGQDNVLTLTVSQPDGVMWDALRFEIGGTANPAVTGWHDYGWGSGNTFVYQTDTVPNN